MNEDLIRYDVLTQEALRGVIRKVLDEVAVAGLPGEHHFFITFDTNHPGVRLSDAMRERYPEAMTIVIQHTFWNLQTDENGFELDLTFNDVRERLRIPFVAIQAFFDPSVKFGLQFDLEAEASGSRPEVHEVVDFSDGSRPGTDEIEPADTATKSPGDDGSSEKQDREAEVVSLDAFRKK